MSSLIKPLFRLMVVTFIFAMLMPVTTTLAETMAVFEFKVLYAEVPGFEKALAGDLDAAIEVLESRAKNVDNPYVADEQATLCALYVVKGKLDAARKTCYAAVDIGQSDLAYNNRGVLRAHLGDTAGALEDFDHARVLPDDQHRFIENLKRGNARLTASRNFAVAVKYSDKHSTNKPTMSVRIENPNN